MGFGQAVKHVFSNYATFSGRASRSEFWWWYVFVVIVQLVLYLISLPLGLTVGGGEYAVGEGANSAVVVIPGIPILTIIWALAILIPTLAVGCRRLHDTDRSGWWWLVYYFCCIIGVIVVIVFWIMPSTPGPNRFGDGPAQA